jgi:outer membrane protein assembly factor BamB
MPSVCPSVLRRIAAGMAVVFLLACPPLWSAELTTSPKIFTSLWHKQVAAQLTGLDLTWDGQTVAFTVAPLESAGEHRLYVFDGTGREVWSAARGRKILGVSLATDGQYTAIGLMDFSVALFSKHGKLLWERKSVGLPSISPQGEIIVAFNNGMSGLATPLLEVFRHTGEKGWRFHRKGRVWRSVLSDQGDLLLSLWDGEALLIDRKQRVVWQQMYAKDAMALATSPEDAQYFAIGTGVLAPSLHLFERTGRLLWRRSLPLGVTEVSLAKQGAFLLSYGNTIHGQHVALYGRSGELQWMYHVKEPATEGSKAVVVPDESLIVAGIERHRRYYVQGFALSGELLWVAPVPDPLFDFRVSRDGRYIAAATDSALYFFDTQFTEGAKVQLQE